MIITGNLKETILDQLKREEVARLPASEADFFALAAELPFKIEYHESEIITMGLSSYWHEVLVMTLGGIFYNLFSEKDEFTILGSNAGVQIPKFEGDYYLPDIMVVKGKPIFKPNSTSVITNPFIVVEVLSKSTAQFDMMDKLPEYKHLESLQQIIYINQKKMAVTSYLRSETPNVWLNQDFSKAEEALTIEDTPVLLKDIYRKIEFTK